MMIYRQRRSHTDCNINKYHNRINHFNCTCKIITVRQITENSGLTRQTFYRNFMDKFDLINWYFDKLLIKSFEYMGQGKTVQEAMQVTNKAVMEALDGLPPVKVHCSLLAEEAIHAALWDYAEKNHITIEGLQKPKNDISEGEEEEDY